MPYTILDGPNMIIDGRFVDTDMLVLFFRMIRDAGFDLDQAGVKAYAALWQGYPWYYLVDDVQEDEHSGRLR